MEPAVKAERQSVHGLGKNPGDHIERYGNPGPRRRLLCCKWCIPIPGMIGVRRRGSAAWAPAAPLGQRGITCVAWPAPGDSDGGQCLVRLVTQRWCSTRPSAAGSTAGDAGTGAPRRAPAAAFHARGMAAWSCVGHNARASAYCRHKCCPGFRRLPPMTMPKKRCMVERTHAWLERNRRLVMHHDRKPLYAQAWVWLAWARMLLGPSLLHPPRESHQREGSPEFATTSQCKGSTSGGAVAGCAAELTARLRRSGQTIAAS